MVGGLSFKRTICGCKSNDVSSSYGCKAKKLNVTTRNTRIDEVIGAHETRKSEQDVTTFFAFNAGAKYIPKRLGFKFVNLKTLMITKSDLRLIEFRDFKNMKKLQKLFLPQNHIEKLPLCIFKYSENLEFINLSGNQIESLNEDVFLNLPNLQQFVADENKISYLEVGLFRNNLNLRKISMKGNELTKIEINFMKIKGVELVELEQNPCVDLTFNSLEGLSLREFQNQTWAGCEGPEVC